MSDPYDVRDDGDRITVRTPTPPWVRTAGTAVLVLVPAGVVAALVLVDDVSLRLLAGPVFLVALVVLSRMLLRREIVADAFGVDRVRRGRRIGWGEVDHVEKPGPYDPVVMLRLEGGERANTGLPAHLAPRLAELGRVPLRD